MRYLIIIHHRPDVYDDDVFYVVVVVASGHRRCPAILRLPAVPLFRNSRRESNAPDDLHMGDLHRHESVRVVPNLHSIFKN